MSRRPRHARHRSQPQRGLALHPARHAVPAPDRAGRLEARRADPDGGRARGRMRRGARHHPPGARPARGRGADRPLPRQGHLRARRAGRSRLWCEVETDWSGLLRSREGAEIEILGETPGIAGSASPPAAIGRLAPRLHAISAAATGATAQPFLLADVFLDERLRPKVSDEDLRSKTALKLVAGIAGVRISRCAPDADHRHAPTWRRRPRCSIPLNAPIAHVRRAAVDAARRAAAGRGRDLSRRPGAHRHQAALNRRAREIDQRRGGGLGLLGQQGVAGARRSPRASPAGRAPRAARPRSAGRRSRPRPRPRTAAGGARRRAARRGRWWLRAPRAAPARHPCASHRATPDASLPGAK